MPELRGKISIRGANSPFFKGLIVNRMGEGRIKSNKCSINRHELREKVAFQGPDRPFLKGIIEKVQVFWGKIRIHTRLQPYLKA